MAPRAMDRCGRAGQTAVEYLMIAGLVTAMLITLTSIIVPTMRWVTARSTEHILLHLSSPVKQETGPPPCPEFVEPEDDVDCVQ